MHNFLHVYWGSITAMSSFGIIDNNVLGSLNLTASLSWYLALEKLIVFDNSSEASLKMAWSTMFDSFCFENIAFFN